MQVSWTSDQANPQRKHNLVLPWEYSCWVPSRLLQYQQRKENMQREGGRQRWMWKDRYKDSLSGPHGAAQAFQVGLYFDMIRASKQKDRSVSSGDDCR
jgi:hypothetical protein